MVLADIKGGAMPVVLLGGESTVGRCSYFYIPPRGKWNHGSFYFDFQCIFILSPMCDGSLLLSASDLTIGMPEYPA